MNHYDTAPGRNFCSHCGAKLDSGALFCSACGTKQVGTSTQETEPLTPPTPTYIPTPTPVYTPTPTPVYTSTPVAAESSASGFRFPIAALIFASIAAIYYLTTLFSNPYSSNFIYKFLHFTPYVLMILGLVLCKKQKNVLFGLAFLVMGGVDVLFWLYDTFAYGWYYGGMQLIVDIFFYLPQLIFTALIGIPYLTGSASAKGMKNSFAAWVIVLGGHIMLFNCIRYIDYGYYGWYTTLLLNFALLTVPTMVAALSYNPFDRK